MIIIGIIVWSLLFIWAVIYEIRHYKVIDEKMEEIVKSWSED